MQKSLSMILGWMEERALEEALEWVSLLAGTGKDSEECDVKTELDAWCRMCD